MLALSGIVCAFCHIPYVRTFCRASAHFQLRECAMSAVWLRTFCCVSTQFLLRECAVTACVTARCHIDVFLQVYTFCLYVFHSVILSATRVHEMSRYVYYLPTQPASVRLSRMKGLLICRSFDKSTLSPYEHTHNTLKTSKVHCVRPITCICNRQEMNSWDVKISTSIQLSSGHQTKLLTIMSEDKAVRTWV